MRKNQLLFFVGKSDWVSIASDGVKSALIASQRAAQGNTTPANSTTVDSAQRTYQANLAYAAQNADQGSMLSKALADGGMKASNTATAAMQWAAQLNASGGQVTPLLFGNDASAGGGFGLSEAQRNARNGGANFSYSNSPLKEMPSNAAKSATNLAADGVQLSSKLKGDTRFADYAANAFTRDRLARQESLIPNAVDRMLADKQIRLNNASNPVRLVDGDKNLSLTPEQASAKFAKDFAEGVYVAPTIGVTALALSTPVALPFAAYSRVAFAGLSARALTTAGAVNTGVGMTVNASFQIASGKDFSYVDLGVSGLTSFATTGATILPSLYINTLGAYGSSLVQLENPIPSAAGAGVGTSLGFYAGKTIDLLPTGKYFGGSAKTVLSNSVSAASQEQLSSFVKNKLEK